MRNLSYAALSAIELPPPQLVSCAAEAGYSHVGLRLMPATPNEPAYDCLGDTAMVREIAHRLAHTGVRVLDIEIVRLKPDTRVGDFEPLLQTGARLGAQHVLVAAQDADMARLADRLAALCALAAPLGLTCQVEPMPWTEVSTLAQAVELVTRSGASNAGVLLDTIHWHRVDGTLADIAAVPRHLLHYAQLCDAPVPRPQSMDEILFQARAERLYPGEGGLDLAGVLRALPDGLPLSVEIPRQALARTEPAHSRALQARKAACALLHSLGEDVR